MRIRLELSSYVIFIFLIVGAHLPLRAGQNADGEPKHSGKVLQLLHEDYPPYVYRKDGKVIGTVAKLATDIASRAGFAIEWRQTYYRRLVREIQLSTKPLCAAGYNQLHKDTYDVVVSKPFAWFPGSALAIRKSDVDLFEKHRSITDIMNDKSLRGAFLMGAKYKGVGEDVKKGHVERHILIGSTDVELGLLVARGRVHFAVLNPDQTDHLRADVASNLASYRPTGMAPPRNVGFICSKATSDEISRRLNDAIEPLPSYEVWGRDTKKITQ